MTFRKLNFAAGLLATALAGSAMAAEGPVPHGVPHLDHVFLIMMENHGYGQILNNPNAPFINEFATLMKLTTLGSVLAGSGEFIMRACKCPHVFLRLACLMQPV